MQQNLAAPFHQAAYTTEATVPAVVVPRAVSQAVKRLVGVLVDDSLNVFPLNDTAR